MKKGWIVWIFLLLLLKAGAQIRLNSLQITTGKTTGLVFPTAIVKVDRGSQHVLVEPVTEAKNILLVKAASPHFAETNLSVVTADGAFYSFTVKYDSVPEQLVYNVGLEDRLNKERLSEVGEYAKMLMGNRREVHGIKDFVDEMEFHVNGIYIKDSVLFFQLQVVNRSSIDYSIDFLRFSIRDRQKMKRTAMQEQELQPLHLAGNAHLIKSNSTNMIVVAMPVFTLPNGKGFLVEMNERNGGRHLRLRVSNKRIIKATILPPFN